MLSTVTPARPSQTCLQQQPVSTTVGELRRMLDSFNLSPCSKSAGKSTVGMPHPSRSTCTETTAHFPMERLSDCTSLSKIIGMTGLLMVGQLRGGTIANFCSVARAPHQDGMKQSFAVSTLLPKVEMAALHPSSCTPRDNLLKISCVSNSAKQVVLISNLVIPYSNQQFLREHSITSSSQGYFASCSQNYWQLRIYLLLSLLYSSAWQTASYTKYSRINKQGKGLNVNTKVENSSKLCLHIETLN